MGRLALAFLVLGLVALVGAFFPERFILAVCTAPCQAVMPMTPARDLPKGVGL